MEDWRIAATGWPRRSSRSIHRERLPAAPVASVVGAALRVGGAGVVPGAAAVRVAGIGAARTAAAVVGAAGRPSERAPGAGVTGVRRAGVAVRAGHGCVGAPGERIAAVRGAGVGIVAI